nr:hypothetical protein [Microcoleus sp. PH2017_01_SCD_O_A]
MYEVNVTRRSLDCGGDVGILFGVLFVSVEVSRQARSKQDAEKQNKQKEVRGPETGFFTKKLRGCPQIR